MSKKIKLKAETSAGQGNVLSPPSKTLPALARKRAGRALSNARQRCENKKDPSYAGYGGQGIKVLIDSIDDLITEIGLPKTDQSLDRIDPHGHYELGNVRWTNAAVQAANKKSSSGNWHLSLGAQVKNAKAMLALQENRRTATLGWRWMLDAYNRGYLPTNLAYRMAEGLRCPGVIEASFDFDTAFDHLNDPGVIHLPALSLPNARVRIRSGPPINRQIAEKALRGGRLGGLEHLDPEWNVPGIVWSRVRSSLENGKAGLVLAGMPAEEDLLGGWIEGACLALASSLAAKLQVTTACFPMLRVNRMIEQLGSPAEWDYVRDPVLDAACLLIPDFALDCGSWADGGNINWWRVGTLLECRHVKGLHTVVGVQNTSKLHSAVKTRILGSYTLMSMPKTEPLPYAELKFSEERYDVPPDVLTLSRMRALPTLSHLVNGIK